MLIMDLDQNRTLDQWAKRFPDVSKHIAVEPANESNFLDHLEGHCNNRTGFILIDVAGVFQKTTIQAATVADLTIIPSKLSAPDIIEASKLHRELEHLSRMYHKPILHRILLNEVNPLWPTYQRHAIEDVRRTGMDGFSTPIHHRAPYAEVFLTGQTPHFADQSREPVRKAVAQLDELTDRILSLLNINQTKATS